MSSLLWIMLTRHSKRLDKFCCEPRGTLGEGKGEMGVTGAGARRNVILRGWRRLTVAPSRSAMQVIPGGESQQRGGYGPTSRSPATWM
jgi:hypothetical protein